MGYYIYNRRLPRQNRFVRYASPLVCALIIVISLLTSQGVHLHTNSNDSIASSLSKRTSAEETTAKAIPKTANGQLLGGSTIVAPPSNSPVASNKQVVAIGSSELFAVVNSVRLRQGLKPLVANQLLTISAQSKCNDMVNKDYWSHNDPSGREPWHFIDETGYRKLAAGENLAYGFSDAQSTVDGWMNSVSHRAAILNPLYTEVGYATCESQNFVQTGPQLLTVQHFGTPLP